jgi:mono/diheme cytochrome c family protein
MKLRPASLLTALWLALASSSRAGLTPEQINALPPPASHPIDFQREIKPIFEASCIKCHGRGRDKGGLRIDTRETLLKGGDTGPAVVPGKSADSLLIAMVAGVDPDAVMPKKGTRLTSEEIGALRAWIDQGMPWNASVGFGRIEPINLKPRLPKVPAGHGEANPVDRFIDDYFSAHGIAPPKVVSDRIFARRAYLDIVGLLPPVKELESFEADKHGDKRQQLVARLLAKDREYAEHWLSFWNDLLRNDYKGTGYIDGGRRQITRWLYSALLNNMSYDQFVAQLVAPNDASQGFTKGIVWRGVVNASQTPQMQAAQNISQVFLGVNLKCASCHDSFINDWQLSDSYGLAGIYSDTPLEISQCDKPTGRFATAKFLYPELGEVHWTTNAQQRLSELAQVITSPKDGRLSRTIVNRLWARFMGRGLVEPVDDMEQPAWNADLLDWLAEDLAAHHYDLKQTIARILDSRTYQLPAINAGELKEKNYVFRGPEIRRLTAEQFRDALTALTGAGYARADAEIILTDDLKAQFGPAARARWIWNDPDAAQKAKVGSIYLRKKVDLPQLPAQARALVVCDNAFTLFVNGHKAGSGDDYKKPFLIDLRPWLKKGTNLVALEAVNAAAENSQAKADNGAKEEKPVDNPAGLYLYARVRARQSGADAIMDFASDASWLVTAEKIDQWQQPEADDADREVEHPSPNTQHATRNTQHAPSPDAPPAGPWRNASELGDITVAPWNLPADLVAAQFFKVEGGPFRAATVAADPLMVAMGRPNREQVVTTRPAAATTLQALELTNGKTVSQVLQSGAASVVAQNPDGPSLVKTIYEEALGRAPTPGELQLAGELVGKKPAPENVEDFLWAMVMMPEFQLIY